jgi:molecular chaperone IbpA
MTGLLFPKMDQLYSNMIGFQETIDMMKAAATDVAKYAPSYPPYNIKQVKDNKYVIEMAVAGFTKTDIEITMDGNKMLIKGNAKDDEDETYLHKGIANRAFERQFTLKDTIEIKDAELANGMLKVWLENMVKTQDFIKKIPIFTKD